MKTAVVTGSTKGIGKAIGVLLLDAGFYVFFNYATDENAADILMTEIESKWEGQYSIIQADLSKKEGVEHLANEVVSKTDTVDVLVLNASKTIRKNFHDMSYEEYLDVIDTNMNLPYYTLKLFDNYINNNGSVIFTGSIMGEYPHATCLPYNVSKAGIHFMVKSLTKDFWERGITINAVSPGFTNTPWQGSKPDDQRKRIENKIALHRFGEPEEIASTVLHIIENRYINGTVIKVDGGYDYY